VASGLKERVERWLREIGYSIEVIPDPSAAWRIQINHPIRSPNKMHIIGPKEADDAVLIAIAAQVSPEHLEGFERLDVDERGAFLWQLRRALNQPPCDYQLLRANGQGVSDPLECPSNLQVSTVRFADGLVTKDDFSRTIGTVYKIWLAGVMVVQERLGGPAPGAGGRFNFKKIGL